MSGKPALEKGSAAEQPCLECCDIQVQGLGSFDIRVLLKVAHLDRFSVNGAKAPYFYKEQLVEFALITGFFGTLARMGNIRLRQTLVLIVSRVEGNMHTAALAAQPASRGIDYNRTNPCIHPCLAAESGQAVECLQDRFLHNVFSIFPGARHAL